MIRQKGPKNLMYKNNENILLILLTRNYHKQQIVLVRIQWE